MLKCRARNEFTKRVPKRIFMREYTSTLWKNSKAAVTLNMDESYIESSTPNNKVAKPLNAMDDDWNREIDKAAVVKQTGFP